MNKYVTFIWDSWNSDNDDKKLLKYLNKGYIILDSCYLKEDRIKYILGLERSLKMDRINGDS